MAGGTKQLSALTALGRQAQACLFADTACISNLNMEFEFIMIADHHAFPLSFSLQTSDQFERVYESTRIEIYRYNQ